MATLPPALLLLDTYQEWGVLIASTSALVLLVGYLLYRLREIPSMLRQGENPTLDPEQLEELMVGQTPTVVDLRPAEVYKGPGGRLRFAVNIPFEELNGHLAELKGKDRDRPLVLVDDTDVLSHQAAKVLRAHGLEWVYVLKGGMKAWRREKFPVYH